MPASAGVTLPSLQPGERSAPPTPCGSAELLAACRERLTLLDKAREEIGAVMGELAARE